MQTAEHLAAQEQAAGPRLVAASKAEAASHAAFFASTHIEGETAESAALNRHAHNMANIACGWVSEAEPRYLADFMSPAIDALTEEYGAWLKANKVAFEGDASELLMAHGRVMSSEAVAWIGDFIRRWEAAAEADPAFYDRQAVVAQ